MGNSSSMHGGGLSAEDASFTDAFLAREARTDVMPALALEYRDATLVTDVQDGAYAPDAPLPPKASDDVARFVCVSDTHRLHRRVAIPRCDVLLHAGDFTSFGELDTVEDFDRWAAELVEAGTARHVVVVAGNHENTLDAPHYDKTWLKWHTMAPGLLALDDAPKARAALRNVTYLEDAEATVDGFRIYGSPWQPAFCGWAFNLPRGGAGLKSKWDLVPDGVDVLLTHSPPALHGDHCELHDAGVHCGCALLHDAVERVRPRAHVFGHIHSGRGATRQAGLDTLFVNAAVCTEDYEPTQKPLVFDLPRKREPDVASAPVPPWTSPSKRDAIAAILTPAAAKDRLADDSA